MIHTRALTEFLSERSYDTVDIDRHPQTHDLRLHLRSGLVVYPSPDNSIRITGTGDKKTLEDVLEEVEFVTEGIIKVSRTTPRSVRPHGSRSLRE